MVLSFDLLCSDFVLPSLCINSSRIDVFRKARNCSIDTAKGGHSIPICSAVFSEAFFLLPKTYSDTTENCQQPNNNNNLSSSSGSNNSLSTKNLPWNKYMTR